MRDIYDDIKAERKRQIIKWGDQRHRLGNWMAILGEEYGEVCAEVCAIELQGKPERLPDLRAELIQVAAVAVQIVENIDSV